MTRLAFGWVVLLSGVLVVRPSWPLAVGLMVAGCVCACAMWLQRPQAMQQRIADLEAKVAKLTNRVG